MRYFLGLVLALALGVMGCSEAAGTGGTAGDGGAGGDGGAAGMGDGGDGGHGGATAQEFPCTEQGILDAIAKGGGPHTFDCDGPTTITINEHLSVEKDLILDGQGNLTIEGGGLNGNLASLELRGLAISNDEQTAVSVAGGALTVVDSRITGGISGLFCAESGCSAAPTGQLALAIRNTIISGGGIHMLGEGPGTIEYSTVEGSDGHGISNSDRVGCGPLTIRNTTVSGNGGYGLNLCGEVTVSNSTVSGNSGEWAISYVDCDARFRMTNSTASGDVRINAHCGELYPVMAEFRGVLMQGRCSVEPYAELTSNGYNIESPGDTCGFDQATDKFDVIADDLRLGELADNGGPTMTHALLPGSVAIDVIPADMCEVDEDQRGVERPQGDACDVGAVEMEVQP